MFPDHTSSLHCLLKEWFPPLCLYNAFLVLMGSRAKCLCLNPGASAWVRQLSLRSLSCFIYTEGMLLRALWRTEYSDMGRAFRRVPGTGFVELAIVTPLCLH